MARAEFARRIDVNPSYVSMLCAGTFWPGRRLMLRILEETEGKVTPNDLIGVDVSGFRVKTNGSKRNGAHAQNSEARRRRQGGRPSPS